MPTSPHPTTRGLADVIHLSMLMRSAGAAMFLVAALGGSAAAQRASLKATIAGRRTTPASDTLTLLITARMTPGWKVGAAKPGKSGVPTELRWRLPDGWRVLASRWTPPTPAVVGRDTVFEYHGPFAIETRLVTGGARRSGPVRALISYGICRDVCIPGRLTLTYHVR
jgi:DsbC/DsbD-like thiol-disulfide interchange protein